MTIAQADVNQTVSVSIASSFEDLNSGETFDVSSSEDQGKHHVRVIHCTVAGEVTVTGAEDSTDVTIPMAAGQTITFGVFKKVVADSTFTGVIGA